MPKLTQAEEFFVVRAPVAASDACYVERTADRALLAAIRARDLACVFAPPGSGKTSLMHHAAAALRRAGELAAVVDLRALSRDASAAVSATAFVERVARELALDVGVDDWCRRRSAQPADDLLVQFFWEIVLTNTTVPVTIFVDDVEAVLGTTFRHDLFAALDSCYRRRGSESDFARLGFALFGCTSLRQLAGDDAGSPVREAKSIDLDDFSHEEAYALAAGFGGAPQLAQALMDRIYAWTDGHPYLTQKVALGVANKSGRLEDVERVVHEQLLALPERDPVLERMHAALTARSKPARRVAKLLRRLSARGSLVVPADAALLEQLKLSGAARVAGAKIVARNRILRELVGRWFPAASGARRAVAAALLVALVASAGGYWYTQRLPSADIATLSDADVDVGSADAAYGRLRALPGFAERALDLYVEALRRRGATATAAAQITAVDTRLRALPGYAADADRLLGEFWLRRAAAAAADERRDAAVLLTQRAVALEPALAGPRLDELLDDDYPHLAGTLHGWGAPAAWQADFATGMLLTVDAGSLRRLPWPGSDSTPPLPPVALTALVHAALERELDVAEDGSAGELTLGIDLEHPACDELSLTLTAPSGAQATVNVPPSRATQQSSFALSAAAGGPLANLADEPRRGRWRLTLVDRVVGNSGALVDWSLRFADTDVSDAPTEPVPIPEPTRTDAVAATIVGTVAVVRPTTAGALGSFALWNLASGQLTNDFAVSAPLTDVAVDPTGHRVLAVDGKSVSLLNVADGQRVTRLSTDTRFVLPPVFSADGGYFAIAESVEGGPPLVSLFRSADASLVGTLEGREGVTDWWLGPGARYVAMRGPAAVVSILDASRGVALARLDHDADVERVLPLADGATVLTVDAAGAIRAWSLAAGSSSEPLGVAASAGSVAVSADGLRVVFVARDGDVVVRDRPSDAELARLRLPASDALAGIRLAADGARLVTVAGGDLRAWTLPERGEAAASAPRRTPVTAVAISPEGDLVVAGRASGEVAFRAFADATSATPGLEYFGHRGAVTAAAVAGTVAATGGDDGIVRLWDVRSGEPIGVVMQPIEAAIAVVALAADGQRVAAAAQRSARIANVADGVVVAETILPAAVRALAIAPDGRAFAIGDAAGTLRLAQVDAPDRRVDVAVGAPVTALAFASARDLLAAGDSAGGVHLLRAADGRELGVRRYPDRVEWVAFGVDGASLLVATRHWLHALRVDPPMLETQASRLGPLPLQAAATSGGIAVRLAGLDSTGRLGVASLDLAMPPAAGPASGLGDRDWGGAFGVRLDAEGEARPLPP